MAKRGRQLRNGDTDLQALTQWVGRKCRNHNPAAELVEGKRSRGCEVAIVKDGEENTVLYQVGDRRFKIEVTEVLADEDLPMVPVGY